MISELIVILLVALIVFGPEKLPEIATHLGKLYKKLHTYKKALHQEILHAEKRQQALDENIKKALDADKHYR